MYILYAKFIFSHNDSCDANWKKSEHIKLETSD